MEYVGIDWAYRRAAWCAMTEAGAISREGFVPADEDGLARLVLELGSDVQACLEMMSGAVWVRDRLVAAGWRVQDVVAHMASTYRALFGPAALELMRSKDIERTNEVLLDSRRGWPPRVSSPSMNGGVR